MYTCIDIFMYAYMSICMNISIYMYSCLFTYIYNHCVCV